MDQSKQAHIRLNLGSRLGETHDQLIERLPQTWPMIPLYFPFSLLFAKHMTPMIRTSAVNTADKYKFYDSNIYSPKNPYDNTEIHR